MSAPLIQSLEDVVVCDLTQNLAGPFCSQILGDLGARIIKVEPPGGDPARAWGPPFWGKESTLFLSANRNKRSIVIDLKAEEGREVLGRIARGSDVFIQSARIGVPERLGYDYESIRALRDDMIHMSISAYGDRGPMKSLPGYDPLMQAFSGVMSVTGHAGGPPARAGGSVVDYGTGMWAAIAILGALRTRDRTGEGAKLDTALLDTAVLWISYHLMGYLSTGQVPGPMGSGLGAIVPYQAFATSDGDVMIAAGNDGIYGRLCRALELDELADDERFATNPQRVAHRTELIPLLEEAIRPYATSDFVELMQANSVPCSPIQDVAQVAVDPQVAAAELLVSAPTPEVPDYTDVALPLRVNGERPRGESTPPAAGRHTVEILEEIGYSPSEIDRLIATRIVESA
ncbi:MAG: CoA transferase [Gemmatimonas sp.]|nr:CoA transferase [Gemmatimonas sp.]